MAYLCADMALTPSEMVPLGTEAPDFRLIQPSDEKMYALRDIKGEKATLIMFICNHCPYVKHVLPELIRLGEEYPPKGVAVIAINSNDTSAFPEDHPREMKRISIENNYPFYYLFDETQQIAQAYDARCTPDFFLYDAQLKLAYRGQLDNSRPGNAVPCNGESLRKAMEDLLHGREMSKEQRPSLGCNIKWK